MMKMDGFRIFMRLSSLDSKAAHALFPACFVYTAAGFCADL